MSTVSGFRWKGRENSNINVTGLFTALVHFSLFFAIFTMFFYIFLAMSIETEPQPKNVDEEKYLQQVWALLIIIFLVFFYFLPNYLVTSGWVSGETTSFLVYTLELYRCFEATCFAKQRKFEFRSAKSSRMAWYERIAPAPEPSPSSECRY